VLFERDDKKPAADPAEPPETAAHHIPVLTSRGRGGIVNSVMSTREMLVEEIRKQPEPVLREVLHYLKFLERQRQEEAWADVLPSREVEQEVLDILDRK
jgi:hypothetical protein